MRNFALFEMVMKEKKWEEIFESFLTNCVKKMESFENVCLMYDTPTWRANTDWLLKMGYK